jgi:hypothetical protein
MKVKASAHLWFGKLVIVVFGQDDMTRRACYRALASTFEINVVFVRETKNVVSFIALDRLQVIAFGVFEVNGYTISQAYISFAYRK